MKEFLGIGGYTRTPEGALSPAHLIFVGGLLAAMTALAIICGRRNRNRDEKTKNRIIIIAALLIDAVEIFKLVVFCARGEGISEMRTNLPLFLCSIQLIILPIAAFSKGRIREGALDFILIFGLLGALLGTVGAFQNYNAYPVLGIENVASGLTHAISGFASLYIGFACMAGMKKRNIQITFGILFAFLAAAFIANKLLDYNYMFLRSDDGTPYSMLTKLVGGDKTLYALGVVVIFVLYMAAFYGVCHAVRRAKAARR